MKERQKKIPKMTEEQMTLLYEGLRKHGRNFGAIIKDPEFKDISCYSEAYLANKY